MNTPLIKGRILLLMFIISAITVPNILAQSSRNQIFKTNSIPTIITEKSNYRADETVRINGTNFQSYERILLSIVSSDKLRQDILLQQWDVFADVNGRITTNVDLSNFTQYGNRFIIEAKGTTSGITTKTEVSTLAPTATSVKLAQCANTNANPQNLDCPNGGNSGWVTGVVGSSKALYFEGDSIAYRNVMEDLVIGNQYKWTVNYDTTKGSLNAIDYLTTYNRSITNANPCADGANATGFCTLGSVTSTFPIPIDPNVTNGRDLTNGTSDDITQIPGVITAWGATITAVSLPTYDAGFPTGDIETSVDITFTATATTAV